MAFVGWEWWFFSINRALLYAGQRTDWIGKRLLRISPLSNLIERDLESILSIDLLPKLQFPILRFQQHSFLPLLLNLLLHFNKII